MAHANTDKKNGSIFSILKPYAALIVILLILTVIGNALNLLIPKIISSAIDTFVQKKFNPQFLAIEFFAVSVLIFIFIYLQNIMQTYISEKVAMDLRSKIAAKISVQDFNYIQEATP